MWGRCIACAPLALDTFPIREHGVCLVQVSLLAVVLLKGRTSQL